MMMIDRDEKREPIPIFAVSCTTARMAVAA